MQSVLDNLCRCFGACDAATTAASVSSSSEPQQTEPSKSKRRTKTLALQDEQWDALFRGPKQRSKEPPPKRRSRKRRRSKDIFRAKRPAPEQPGPFSRFLSNNSVLANSLCFATPVKDSHSDPPSPERHNSMLSDTNTLNTAGEETVSSTVYYETTKLAGLSQKSPPMPLFDRFQVEPCDEIRRIVATRSHSSHCALDWQGVVELSDEDESDDECPHDELEDPPAMIHSSSDSSSKSPQEPPRLDKPRWAE